MKGVDYLIKLTRDIQSGENLDPGKYNIHLKDIVRHRVELYFPLDILSKVVDANVFPSFKNSALRIQVRTLRQKSTFRKVNLELRKQGIYPTLLKGLALNDYLYDGETKRTARDLDVLIFQEHVFLADRILIDLGFQRVSPNFEIARAQQKLFLNEFNQIAYHHPVWKTQLEIHWRLFKSNLQLNLSRKELNNFTVPVQSTQGMGEYNTLHPALHLLFISVHGLQHRWDSLIWLFDLDQFLKIISDDDLRQCVSLANKHHLLDQFLIGFSIIENVLDTPLPLEIKSLISNQHNNIAKDCLVFLNRQASKKSLSESWKKWLFKIKYLRSSKERIRSLYTFSPYSLRYLHFKTKLPHVLLRPIIFIREKSGI